MPRRTTHTEKWWAAAPPTRLRCTAHYKSDGGQCRSEAWPGTNVCDKHGALIPGVQAAAATRVQMSVDSAATQLVEWMNDPNVDMRERVKIAHDMLDRGGLGATSRHLIGIVTEDPLEKLFSSLLADPHALVDPDATPPAPSAEALELNRQALEEGEGDIVDAELVEEPTRHTRIPAPEPTARNPATPPKHIRAALERLL